MIDPNVTSTLGISEERTPLIAAAVNAATQDFWANDQYNVRVGNLAPDYEPNLADSAALHGLREVITSKDLAAQALLELISITMEVPVLDIVGSWQDVAVHLLCEIVRTALLLDLTIATQEMYRRSAEAMGPGPDEGFGDPGEYFDDIDDKHGDNP